MRGSSPGDFVSRVANRLGVDGVAGCKGPNPNAIACGQTTEAKYWATREALVTFLATGRDLRPQNCAVEVADRAALALPEAAAGAGPKMAAAALYVVAAKHCDALRADDSALDDFLRPALAKAAYASVAKLKDLIALFKRHHLHPKSLDFDLPVVPSPVSVLTTFDHTTAQSETPTSDQAPVVDWTNELYDHADLFEEPPPL